MNKELFGIRPSYSIALVSLIVAIGQFRLLQLTMPFFDYQHSINESLAILEGHPTWIIYQSRVLGPIIVLLLSKITGSFVTAHVLFFVIFHALAGFLIARLISQLANPLGGWLAFWMFQALFSLLLMNGWLFAWDNVGIIIFTLFVYFVITEKPWLYFSALFAVAILNRESAFYIGLWMVASPLCHLCVRGTAIPCRRIDWRLLIAGLGCIVLGWICIHFLRSHILVREAGPLLWGEPQGQVVHFRWSNNLDYLWRGLNPTWNETSYSFGMESAVGLFLLYLLGVIAHLAFINGGRWAALALAHFALYVSVLVFASLRETRVLLEFLPLIVFSVVAIFPDQPDSISCRGPRTSSA